MNFDEEINTIYKQKWSELTKEEIKKVNEDVCDDVYLSQKEVDNITDKKLKEWFEADPNSWGFR